MEAFFQACHLNFPVKNSQNLVTVVTSEEIFGLGAAAI